MHFSINSHSILGVFPFGTLANSYWIRTELSWNPHLTSFKLSQLLWIHWIFVELSWNFYRILFNSRNSRDSSEILVKFLQNLRKTFVKFSRNSRRSFANFSVFSWDTIFQSGRKKLLFETRSIARGKFGFVCDSVKNNDWSKDCAISTSGFTRNESMTRRMTQK